MNAPSPRRESREQQQRLFIAVELPQAWLDAFRDYVDQTRAALSKSEQTKDVRLRWVRPEGIHLTLKFLGEVSLDQRLTVERTMTSAVVSAPGLQLALGRIGSFTGRDGPRVLWAGVEGETRALAALAGRIDAELAAAGFAPERRSFAPHLTLARLPEGAPASQCKLVVDTASAISLPAVEPFGVHAVALVRSHLGPGGTRHEIVRTWP